MENNDMSVFLKHSPDNIRIKIKVQESKKKLSIWKWNRSFTIAQSGDTPVHSYDH